MAKKKKQKTQRYFVSFWVDVPADTQDSFAVEDMITCLVDGQIDCAIETKHYGNVTPVDAGNFCAQEIGDDEIEGR